MKTLRETLDEINRWQDQVFTKATPESAAAHLRREAQELYENPHDPEEVADIFILLAAVSHLAGIDLVEAVEAKMKINRERTWGEPDSEGVVEHIKDGVIGQQVKGKTLLEVFEEDGLISIGNIELNGNQVPLFIKEPENMPKELKSLLNDEDTVRLTAFGIDRPDVEIWIKKPY